MIFLVLEYRGMQLRHTLALVHLTQHSPQCAAACSHTMKLNGMYGNLLDRIAVGSHEVIVPLTTKAQVIHVLGERCKLSCPEVQRDVVKPRSVLGCKRQLLVVSAGLAAGNGAHFPFAHLVIIVIHFPGGVDM
jgi:hypothetical protein